MTVARHLAHRLESVIPATRSDTSVDQADMANGVTPKVSIGIPTFNRASQLSRAVASCRSQSYQSLEIIISDNASDDDTARICQEWQEADPRLLVIRQVHNIGRERNFKAVLQAASGEFFVWLSDDDWLDDRYVATCMGVFARRPDCSMVGGTVLYTLDSGAVWDEPPTALNHEDSSTRVLDYLAGVGKNGEYYGLMRRRDMLRAEYPITFAGDWYFVAQMAAVGPIVTAPSVVVHRDLTGASSDITGLAESYGLPSHWGYDLHLWALLLCAPSLALGRGTFGDIPFRRRLLPALRLAGILARRWWHHENRWIRTTRLGWVRERLRGLVGFT